VPRSLYFVGRGVLSVLGDRGGTETEALRFGPGDHYGEIGLLTGSAAPVTITALAPSVVYGLENADLVPVLEANPQLARDLGQALAERQAAGQALAAAAIDRSEAHGGLSNWFFDRIQRWLEQEAPS
jgi:CRP-like cAMP-binding protein